MAVMEYSSDADWNDFLNGMQKGLKLFSGYNTLKNPSAKQKGVWENRIPIYFPFKTIIELEKEVSNKRRRIEVMQGGTSLYINLRHYNN